MNKFEQLIEYVINDEEQKARDLFHEIVVEKSRGIYEELMAEEEIEEAKDEDEELDEAKDEELDEAKDEEELDEAKEEDEELDESMMDEMGGDQADDLIDDIETEEQGLSMEGDEEMADEEGGEGDLEDRVVDLEDKLDELMAEFEALMGDDGQEGEDEMDIEVGSDDIETDGMGPGEEETMDTEMETMEGEELEEAINLKAAPAPVKSEEGGINKKSIVAANSGAKGMDGKPVMSSDTPEKGRPAPTAKNIMTGEVQNAPAKSTVKLSPATKPHLAQATGVNTKSPVA